MPTISNVSSQAGAIAVGKDHVTLLSSSDHSDIVTLGDMKHIEHAEEEEEAAAGEALYLGTSSSSQYTFTPAETGRTAVPHVSSWFQQRDCTEELPTHRDKT